MLGFGIIGTGDIAHTHIEAINAIARPIGVFSRSKERAREYAKKYKVKAHLDLNEMLDDPDIHIVDVVTVNNLHAEHASAAIRKGKHVIVEKPIDTDVNRARALVTLAKNNNRKLATISQWRFAPAVLEINDKLDTVPE